MQVSATFCRKNFTLSYPYPYLSTTKKTGYDRIPPENSYLEAVDSVATYCRRSGGDDIMPNSVINFGQIR